MSGDEYAYEQARQKLLALVLARNKLLLRLDGLTLTPLNLSPASGLVADFDRTAARQIIDEVDRLAPQIDDLLAEVNRLAVECGKPTLDWQGRASTRKEH